MGRDGARIKSDVVDLLVSGKRDAVQRLFGQRRLEQGLADQRLFGAVKAQHLRAVFRLDRDQGQRRDADQVNVGKILDEAAPVAPSAAPSPKKAVTPVRPATIPLKLALDNVSTPRAVAPGVVAGTDVRATNEASVAFRSYIANAKIGGVFQGQPTRVLINGRIVRPGDSVDEKLAITFIEVEAVDRLLVFKDGTDARVTRRY